MRRQFIAERADWTLSAGESPVQQERLEHLANAFKAHNLQRACHCLWLALSMWRPTEVCAYGPDLLCVCQTGHSFQVLINGLSKAMPLRLCINHWIKLSNGRTWAHTQSAGLQRMNAMHTSVLGDAQVLTDTVKQAHTDKTKWDGQKGIPVHKQQHTHLNWCVDRSGRTYIPCLAHKGISNSVTEDSLPRLPTLTDIQVSKSIHLKQALLKAPRECIVPGNFAIRPSQSG